MSTVDQDPELQFDALRAHGIADLHIETGFASGAKQDRPGLTRLLAVLERGDVLTVWKLDRLGRSMSHPVAVVDGLGRRGIEFHSLTDSIDTTTPAGRFAFHSWLVSLSSSER